MYRPYTYPNNNTQAADDKQLAESLCDIVKAEIDRTPRLGKDMKEAQKAMVDATKELFVNHDINATLSHLSSVAVFLNNAKRKQ